MRQDMQSALFAGIASCALYALIYGAGLGFLFLFIPTLPILFAGLQHDANVTMRGATVAAILILLLMGTSSAIVYMFLLGVPSWYLVRHLLRSQVDEEGRRHWFPVGVAMAGLSLYATAFIGSMIAFYAGRDGGLPAMISKHITESLAGLEDQYGEAIHMLANDWSFLLFPITIWLWAMCLYLHVWLANRALVQRGRALRDSVAVTPFAMPGGMLYLLAVAALASLIGSESMRFFGKSALLILILPYFFSGLALIHHHTAEWPSQRFLLIFIYIAIFAQVWPALIIAALGVAHQLKNINKHLPRGGSSSKN